MTNTALDARLILRNDTFANWNSKNPVLLKGELAVVADLNKIKIGNGVDTFSTLDYSGFTITDIPIASNSVTGLMNKTEFVKLVGIETGSQVNKIEVIKVNGIASAIASGKIVDIIVPTKISQLTNDSDFTTKAYADGEIVKKVDKVAGKSLVSDSEITRLSGMTSDATKVENSTVNGNIKINGAEATIYTHPTTHPATMIVEDSTHRFTTDTKQAAWDSKADTKADVGLGNVTNDSQVKRSEMGIANGVATLGSDGKLTSGQIPAGIDDVLEATNLAALPTTGESNKIYVTTNDNKTYRWSGSTYVEISASVVLGETSSTAYAGDKGKLVTDNVNKITNGAIKVPSSSNADTIGGLTVKTAVPVGAVFTDTVYIHPNTHPYSMITGTPTSLPANGGNAATVNGKTVLSNVPADAKFTDTIYTLPSTVLHSTDVFILNGGNA
ncbi:MAG: hypothetical protein RR806_03105 [Oscillospiraceae bacterium]